MTAVLDRLDGTIAGLLRYLSASHLRALLAILVLASLVTLPGLNTLPVTDRDEARYVQASKQMMETGDYIDIRNLDAPRWKKPVGIYWLQVASAKVLGEGTDSAIWAYRVPSALGIIIAALLTYWALFPLIGAPSALIGGLVVASTATTAVEAHIAKTDAVLLAATVLVFGALVRINQNRDAPFNRAHVLMWLGLGFGFLIKGPIILIPFIGALIWISIAERSLSLPKAISPLKGLLLFALIAAPWYIAIALKTDGAFFAESLGKDLLGKVGQVSEKHGGPFGYYLMTMWLTFWPWAPLALLAVPIAWNRRTSPEMRLLAGWIIPCWAVFALSSTKLPHYVLPALPALAALIGLGISEVSTKYVRILGAFLFVIGSVAAGVFAFGPLPVFQDELPLVLIASGLITLTLVILATTALGLGRLYGFTTLGVAALLIMFPTLTLITAPRTNALFISPRLVAAHNAYQSCADRPIRSVGYQEMSLAFLGGTDTQFISLEEAAKRLDDPEGGWRIFIRLDGTGEVLPRLSETSGRLIDTLAVIEGTNYNSGKEVTIVLVGALGDPLLLSCRPN